MHKRKSERQRCARAALQVILLLAVLSGAAVAQGSSSPGSISGHLVDANHNAIPNASIRLSGGASRLATSDISGGFEFHNIVPGRYRITAILSTGQTISEWIDVGSGATTQVALEFHQETTGASGGESSAALSQSMQFADDPHFTIAGIADWTAAGGHGSDASLRTSEALTRETLKLAPDNNSPPVRPCTEGEAALKAAVASQPRSFEAEHCLGLFYLRSRKYADAVRLLETAYSLERSDAENEYALAEACKRAGESAGARKHLENLSAHANAADLHRLAGLLNESLGDPVTAVNEFAQAARMDPSEQNYFAWGSELLYHRAVLQARDVFEQGVRAWPKSARMLTALGVAFFSAALYDDAAGRLCQAAGLEPDNPEPYLFMGRIVLVAPRPLPCVAQKLAEFHRRHPENALADYYFAMALREQQPSADSPAEQQVAELLHEAVTADPRCGEAWLELGNLQARSGNYASAISLYSKAIDAKPDLSEGYYRLGMAFDRTGQSAKAREAFAKHDELRQLQAAEVEQQRREIKQFVISSAGTDTAGKNPRE
ncbi:MAG TPA: tetratricopeptide repeat protein [Acidobacteriaceae bacterium]|nr:tetratricopeptide repeat protein [Acidobacteriaceae bacterium]